jgi:hypothetical protein
MRIPTIVLAIATLLGPILPRLQASEFDKKTFLTFNQSVEIPGMILPAGEYVMKRADASLPDVVRFTSADENHVYATVFALPTYRQHPTDKVEIVMEERRANAPEAIKKWFYPGDRIGAEFVYPKSSETLIAALTEPSSPAAPASASSSVAPQPAPTPLAKEAEGQELVETSSPPKEVEIAQSTLPAEPQTTRAQQSQPTPQPTTQEELPRTASNVPLVAMFGVLCVIGGIVLRQLSRSVA